MPAGVDFACVEAATLLRIAQDVVGRADFLELGRLALVAGRQVGMQCLRKLAIGLLDLGLCGVLRDAEYVIWIVAHGFPFNPHRLSARTRLIPTPVPAENHPARYVAGNCPP